MHRHGRLAMLDLHETTLHNGRDDRTERRRLAVQRPFAGEIGLLH
jgi:hypothetical protein